MLYLHDLHRQLARSRVSSAWLFHQKNKLMYLGRHFKKRIKASYICNTRGHFGKGFATPKIDTFRWCIYGTRKLGKNIPVITEFLLKEYTTNSCKAMQELFDQLIALESRSAYKDFLLPYLRRLLNRAVDTKNFFMDSIVIAKENTQVKTSFRGRRKLDCYYRNFFKKTILRGAR
ncbi:hypothetical protein [Hungatella effluvii]|uniref:hypothetical protein n=1 Tax=Hungatella effluvii TaxID=1096246 RepID=UPI002A8232DC|nr:hypothetical protein [Hungatella effluvii]